MKKIMLGASILFLAGCGGRAPIRRAQEILFEVPYIQQKQQYESVSVGVKKLSIPEIKELFCDSDTLLKTYNVYYVRTHNNGNETYFMHVADQPLPTRKEIESFFNPHTTMHTIAHVLFIVPAGIGLSLLAPDPLSYFVGFAGLNIGLHIAEAQSLGVEGYKEFENYVLVADAEHRMTSITTTPHGSTHHLVFVPQRDVQSKRLVFTLSSRNKMSKELVFDFSAMMN